MIKKKDKLDDSVGVQWEKEWNSIVVDRNVHSEGSHQQRAVKHLEQKVHTDEPMMGGQDFNLGVKAQNSLQGQTITTRASAWPNQEHGRK